MAFSNCEQRGLLDQTALQFVRQLQCLACSSRIDIEICASVRAGELSVSPYSFHLGSGSISTPARIDTQDAASKDTASLMCWYRSCCENAGETCPRKYVISPQCLPLRHQYVTQCEVQTRCEDGIWWGPNIAGHGSMLIAARCAVHRPLYMLLPEHNADT